MADARKYALVFLTCAVLQACLGDLKPDVGPLLATDGDDGTEPGGDGSDDDGERPGGHVPDAGMADDGADGPSGDGGPSEQPDAGGGGSPDPDPGPDPSCVIGDSDPEREVSFAGDVMPVLEACTCHDSGSDDPFAILESGLTIENYDSFVAGGYDSGADIVVPGNACESIVLLKLGEAPPFGERMPLDGPYLSDEEIGVLSDWIVEGARDN